LAPVRSRRPSTSSPRSLSALCLGFCQAHHPSSGRLCRLGFRFCLFCVLVLGLLAAVFLVVFGFCLFCCGLAAVYSLFLLALLILLRSASSPCQLRCLGSRPPPAPATFVPRHSSALPPPHLFLRFGFAGAQHVEGGYCHGSPSSHLRHHCPADSARPSLCTRG
jgi:hypothetical protein